MGVAAAIAGAAVVGAGASVVAANKAAKASKKGAQLAADTERYMYDTSRADYAPYREVGQEALYKLADMYGVSRPMAAPAGAVSTPAPTDGSPYGGLIGSLARFEGRLPGSSAAPVEAGTPTQYTPGYSGFEASPGYQFRLSEGLKAAERSAAARGLLGSGATLKALQRYGEGLASSEYENYANRLAALAGVGQTATAGTAAAGAQAAGGIAQAYQNAGNARASAYQNTGQAISNTAGGLASAYLYNKGFGGGGMVSPPGTSGGNIMVTRGQSFGL